MERSNAITTLLPWDQAFFFSVSLLIFNFITAPLILYSISKWSFVSNGQKDMHVLHGTPLFCISFYFNFTILQLLLWFYIQISKWSFVSDGQKARVARNTHLVLGACNPYEIQRKGLQKGDLLWHWTLFTAASHPCHRWLRSDCIREMKSMGAIEIPHACVFFRPFLNDVLAVVYCGRRN